MSEVTERSVFKGDEFQPLSFGTPVLLFMLKHVGKTPRGAGFVNDEQTGMWAHDQLPRPVWGLEARVALQRLYEETHRDEWNKSENKQMLDKIRNHIKAALEYRRRKAIQSKRFKQIDYDSIGIGGAEGQSRYENFFKLQLAYKHVPMKKNWVQDIVDKLAGGFDPLAAERELEEAIDVLTTANEEEALEVIEDVLAADEGPQISYKCFACDWEPKAESQRPKAALRQHLVMKHPDRLDDFDAIEKMATEAVTPENPTPPEDVASLVDEVMNA